MKRAGRILTILAGLYVGLMLISGLALKFFVGGGRLAALLSTIGADLPVEVEVGEGEFDLINWVLFQPAISLGGLRVANLPGFSADPMLEAEALSVQLTISSLFSDEVHILSFTLEEPVLRVETNREGQTNFEALIALTLDTEAEAGGAIEAPEGISVTVDQLIVRSGTLRYTRPDMSNLDIGDVDIALSNFAESRACDIHLDAILIDGGNTRLAFNGQGGPYSKLSLPAEGDLSLVVAPGEIPADIRATYFDRVLGEPGADGRIRLEVAMKGDVFGVFGGDGILTLSDLTVGRDADHQLAFEGQVPVRVDGQMLLANPKIQLLSQNVSMKLGEGRWKGRVLFGYTASQLAASSSGSISGVRIEELLGAFTTTENAVYGSAEITQYTLSATGQDAKAMRNSLTGNGRIEVKDGYVALFNLLDAIERHAKELVSGESAADGQTEFLRLTAGFDIANRRINSRDVVLERRATTVTAQGYVTFDEELHFDAAVRGPVAQLIGGAPDASEVPVASIPVSVRGTIDSPRVQPDVGKILKKGLSPLQSVLKGNQKAAEEPQP